MEVIELFEKENPNIKLEAEFTDFGGYWEKLNTQTAANNWPDVINMDNSKINECHSRDLLADLTQFIDEGKI